jgi:hypothetical protein
LRQDLQRHGNQPLPAWVEIIETHVLLAAIFGDSNAISTTANAAVSVITTDMDSDGDQDVLSVSASRVDDKIAWYENLGDGTPALSVDDVSLAEEDSGETDFTFTISIAEPSASDVTVDFATADNSAGAPDDYTAISGTATIAAGATSTTLTVKIQGDTTGEATETFFVILSNPVNTTIADRQRLDVHPALNY